MEVDITDFFKTAEHADFSASQAERGANVARDTYQAACAEGARAPLLPDEDHRQEFRDWVKAFGSWPKEEIDAWTEAELNALLIQFISGDARELETLTSDKNGEIDWTIAEALVAEGIIPGRVWKGDNQKIYFDISN